ncbi:MAG: hypothetical protein ACK55Z_02045, partial [bacterium]
MAEHEEHARGRQHGSLAWVALLPGQVYMERGEKFLEYNVQADHDNDWKHEAYHRKLLLAGGANI